MESRNPTAEPSNKRPRSPTIDHPPQSKVPKTHSNHLQINYLARQYPDNLPLVSADDTMPAIIHLIGEYDGVLQRHESIAGNLGACPLGPILIKRFERLFDGPPKVLKTHGKDGPTVTWLDVVEFAKSKPEQFNLEKTRNGVRVCQFYTKQCRVEISEEDFVLIASGMPQKMIPPQPIIEDEEKELGGLEILEKNLQQIIQMADQVSARARQLSYRLKNRRTAIMTRRENDASLQMRSGDHANGHSTITNSPGFLAVNAARAEAEAEAHASQFMFPQSNTDNVTIINGTSVKGASPTTRSELMKKFFTTADRQTRGLEDPAASGNPPPAPQPRGSDPAGYSLYNTSSTPVAIPGTPSSLLPPPKTAPQEKDEGGPFKTEMIAHMEELQRGERVVPPCDRCRRLHMDCVKNLTACVGCTKKHCKCSWREVKEEEIRAAAWSSAPRERPEPDRPVSLPIQTHPTGPYSPHGPHSADPPPAPASAPEQYPRYSPQHNRRESAPGAPHVTPGPAPLSLSPRGNSPRRAKSETENGGRSRPAPNEEEDPDANQRLMRAIMDTVDHHTRVAAAVQERERVVERAGDVSYERETADRERDRDRDRDHARERELERERMYERERLTRLR
ncbi:hypothetical protein N7470_009510 [Penicillium chermesinum]|nr:hypothetical protein N7470_009510 [Penicillium chermesinum]